jgi:dihydropteroate synthase-like protein
MSERILFLTGRLAETNLRRVLAAMQPGCFTADIRQLGINVAGLMTAEMISRRLPPPPDVDRIIVPGRCRGDLDQLTRDFGIPVQRGPDELKDLTAFFGQGAQQPDLGRYDIRIFAEIVDAPDLNVEQLLQRAQQFREAGADVIDIGCLPHTPFPHLAESVQALCEAGYIVSVDSMNTDELLTGGRAGADYLLSLNEDTLWLADEVEAVPVLVPREPGDLASLMRAMDSLDGRQRAYLADPVLDPLLLGFTESITRYRYLRLQRPQAAILMGVGNVTELTDADTAGINALLIGIATELGISSILTTQVSAHARRAVAEADVARRMMFAARADNSLPRNIDTRLMATHERHPFPYSRREIEETAAAIRDPSYRVEVSADGIHVYNRDGMHSASDPFELYPRLEFGDDTGHAFYMGAELARAQIAFQLGKRYVQDQELAWGCATDSREQDLTAQDCPGSTRDMTGSRT